MARGALAAAPWEALLELIHLPSGQSEWRHRHLQAPSRHLHIRLPYTTSQPAYIKKRAEHSGVGLYAARNIRAGELLIAEEPLATWCVSATATTALKRDSFLAMAAKLPATTVEAILQLSQSEKYGASRSLLGAWQTNALPINYESETRPGMHRHPAGSVHILGLPHACAIENLSAHLGASRHDQPRARKQEGGGGVRHY